MAWRRPHQSNSQTTCSRLFSGIQGAAPGLGISNRGIQGHYRSLLELGRWMQETMQVTMSLARAVNSGQVQQIKKFAYFVTAMVTAGTSSTSFVPKNGFLDAT